MTSIAQQFGRDEWTRFTAKQRMTRYAVLLTCGLAIAWALTSIEVIWAWVWGAPEQIGDLFGRMYPPDAS
ncbi:MAG: phosphonate ABC transporter, permease protein PhnE, partial [Alphaproteobacteria bacterium]|nr:phosphonate ABC transporter, permease protein PhnE [Alphaproteobacteria bacterium]